jgi:heptose I phosphotransferase
MEFSAMRDTFWQRWWYGVHRVRHRDDWVDFVGPDWAEQILDVAVTDRFHAKQGRSTGRWILYRDERRLAVYLKRHHRLPWWRGWLAALRPDGGWSPALQEWRNLQWAKSQGFPVPAAVAVGEWIGPWGRLQSFLAVEELADMLPLHEAIPAAARSLDPKVFQQWKRGLIGEVARLTRRLHGIRRFHKDLYLCHFYIPHKFTVELPQWQGHVHLIDLHRLGHHPWAWRWWQVKDLAQLLYSSEVPGVTARDRLRFWRAYLTSERDPLATGWLRWAVLAKWRRYRGHNRR